MQLDSALADLDPRDPAFIVDPYPRYAALRQSAPVYRSELLRGLVLTRADDVASLLRDRRFGMNYLAQRRDRNGESELNRPYVRVMGSTVATLNGDDHDRHRAVFRHAFSPRAARNARAAIVATTEAAVDNLIASREADLVESLSLPLPLTLIGALLDVPVADHRLIGSWARDLTVVFQGLRLDDRAKAKADEAATQLLAYFGRRMKTHEPPPGSLLADLVAAASDGRLSNHELLSNLVVLYIAGYETTANLMSLAVLNLLRHPDQWAALREDPSRAVAAATELARFDTSGQATTRVALGDTELLGTPCPKGTTVFAVLGAAQRDPSVFEDPDMLDISRNAPAAVTFGAGPHACPGQAIARLELEILLKTLAERAPDLALAGEPSWLPTPFMRGLASLPVGVRR